MRCRFCRALIALIVVICGARAAIGDAIMVTQAMKASTIVEIYVTADAVRVELSIGPNRVAADPLADLRAFRNVMPDEVYEKLLGYEAKPLAERVGAFFGEDWVIRLADGSSLAGKITRMEGRKRITRDVVTGDPVPVQDSNADYVMFIELLYPLADKPVSLTIAPPGDRHSRLVSANIGFVVYHDSLPVTDFRYLSAAETLNLDWDDPWFSRFANPNLRRQNDSPIQAFLYVDSFEVRKEIICRPKDIAAWLDLGIEGKKVIPVADQEAMKKRIAGFLAKRSPVLIDGKVVEPILDRIHFVRRTLRRTGIIDPPRDLDVTSATLGVIFIYPTADLPREVTMTWDMFNDRIRKLPTVATDEAGGMPYTLAPDDAVLKWQNFLINPTKPSLVSLLPPPGPRTLSVPVISVACGAFLLILLLAHARGLVRRKRPSIPAMTAAGVLIVVGAVTVTMARVEVVAPFAGPRAVSDTDAEQIVTGLLKNTYHAFDFRDDEAIYTTLNRSATGDLLERIYLETRKALEVRNTGGVRTKVKAVDLVSVRVRNFEKEVGFTARATWNVSGSVGHWGHIHQRTNQYEADLTIAPSDGQWKMTDIEVLDEKRI